MKATTTDTAWALVCQKLEEKMQVLREEIRNYPAPIPACDAQFNYLLEEREALSLELARARELMGDVSNSEDSRTSIDAFLGISAYLDDSAKRDIRALIETQAR